MSYKKKTIDKTTINNIREIRVREREKKRTRKVANPQGATTRVIQKTVDKLQRPNLLMFGL
jgi:hypothetical protein